MKQPPRSNGAGSKAPPLPAGEYKARCYMMAAIGTQEHEWQGEKKNRFEVVIGWIYPEHEYEFEEGAPKPYAKTKRYTYSLHPKANLRRDLEAWRGQAFADEYPVFDIEKVAGTACRHNLILNPAGDGNWISSITSIKQSDCPQLDDPPIVYDIQSHDQAQFERLPGWVQELICRAPEFKGFETPPKTEAFPDDEEEDDIPF